VSYVSEIGSNCAPLQDAPSVAGLLVTAEAMVAELPKDTPATLATPDGGGMGY
jgi:chaperonin GroEL